MRSSKDIAVEIAEMVAQHTNLAHNPVVADLVADYERAKAREATTEAREPDGRCPCGRRFRRGGCLPDSCSTRKWVGRMK